MIVTVLYKRTPDLWFNMDYYLADHMTLAKDIWTKHGLLHCSVCKPTEDSEFAVKTMMMWKDEAAWKAALEDEGTGEIMEDVKKVTNGTPTFVVAEVVAKVVG
jgi:uncharacterized protein (TIGR02118 family)